MVTAQGVVIFKLDIVRVKVTAIAWILIMLDNHFPIEVVHIYSDVRFQVSRFRHNLPDT